VSVRGAARSKVSDYEGPTMKELYEHYLQVLASIREFFRDRGVVEFLPACSSPRLVASPEEQLTIEGCNLILPYSQSYAKPLAALFLGKSVWMAAPSYRNDEGHNHLKWYYQITAEFLGHRMRDVTPIACDLIRSVSSGFGKELPDFDEVDLTAHPEIRTDQQFDDWCRRKTEEAARPLVVLNKPHGTPPYVHRSYQERPDIEVGFDVLLPGVGEVLSGGERNMNLIREAYRFSNVDLPEGHSTSFGLGLERLVAYVLDLDDIREAVLLQNRVADVPWDELLSQGMYYDRIPMREE
jgi:aspartyl/asparaginyl-tRNA synthetase